MVKAPKLPELTLSLPLVLGLIVIFMAIGAGVVFTVLRSSGRVVEPTVTPTVTVTPTITVTPTATATATPEPTWTPLPPIEYTIAAGDFCSSIAAFFNVSIQSIVVLNNLPADCGVLSVGQKLLIPQPTPTASPQPTQTLSGVAATEDACEKYSYTVNENDTLMGIANSFNVSMEAIKEFNSLPSDVVYSGQALLIPLCRRNPTPGPTPTATLPPPYPAPNLLLPTDGESFAGSSQTITLQWASVGTLRTGEAYAVTIEDVTAGTNLKVVEYVTDTKLIVPASMRPTDNAPHIIRWYVNAVRQSGTTQDGEPLWVSFGKTSEQRVFSWTGSGSTAETPAAQ
ncbi:hypothetical protein ADN00_18700 [Ornatilinea apprima]|uniref:LysM domain-containing protein n=1 Tax=Ornatilinea apprima TaxID=1134406 RepID=A0A0P6WVW0_9CHLR|nr:LysM peptidoglycan-binding domain-containing protein [Ornatilinea apprima]KPL70078.1 hypothetical protein ADN00_18700 [Ornatilinea apprima]